MSNDKSVDATANLNEAKELRFFIESARSIVAIFDNRMRYIGHSPSWVQHFELEGQQLLGHSLYDIQKDIAEPWKIIHQRAMAGETLATDGDQFERLDGTVLWVRWEVRPWYREKGLIGGIVIRSDDITARKRAEQELILSEEKFNTIFREAPIWMEITDWNESTYQDVNDAALNSAGFSRDEVIGQTAVDIGWLKPGSREIFKQEIQRNGRIADLEMEFYTKSGETIYGLVNGNRVIIHGKPHLLTVTTDISARRHAELALKENVALLKATLGTAPVGISRVRDRILVEVGDAMCSMMGYRREELIGQDTRRFFLTEEEYEIAGRSYTALLERASILLETRFVTKDGRVLNVVANSVWMDPDNKDAGVIVAIMDITERKQAQLALQESETKFSTAFQTGAVAMMITAENGRIVDANRACCAVFNYEQHDIIGKTLIDLGILDSAERGEFLNALQRSGGVLRNIERRIAIHDGSYRDVVYSATTVTLNGRPHILSTAIDMTERNALLEQLRQSQKLEAVGTLAGGIAHDFNNILASIIGFTSLARQIATDNHEMIEYLDQIAAGSQRASELVKQILTFSRAGSPELKLTSVGNVVGEAIKLLRSAIPKSIQIETQIANSLPMVMANATQLHQVIMNLGTNAWQAMQDQPGRLTITLNLNELDDVQARALVGISAGRYLQLTIEDTGSGISLETQKRIFEPFFTTKSRGQGTGLGLSVVHGIVRAHHGAIRVSSELDRGTTFDVFLPTHNETSNTAGVSQRPLVARGNGEHILFVDDEPALVQLGQLMLSRLGYNVTGETQPLKALAQFESEPMSFHLVVTDQSMPGMTGIEFATRVHRLRPDLPVLLASGYAATLTADKLETIGIRELLNKPYGESELAAAVHAHLQPAKRPH
jgi:PAS domain S-box-containing protein